MAKKKPSITPEEKSRIDDQDKSIRETLDSLERAKQFKVGDFLILWWSGGENRWNLDKNSYGAPNKYQVVYVTESGIPWMKKINANGTPIGEIMSGVGDIDDGYLDNGTGARWELDPDYADSLLLQDEYNPAQLHDNRKVLWKEVTEHNKLYKVPTQEIPQIVDFFKTLKAGDIIWTSNISHLVVQDIKILAKADALKLVNYRFSSRVKGPFVLVTTIVDKKGVVKDVAADFFYRKALYRERPRTYKELNL